MKKLNFKLMDEKTGRSLNRVDVPIEEINFISEVKLVNEKGRNITATLLTKKDKSTILINDSPFHVDYAVKSGQFKWKK